MSLCLRISIHLPGTPLCRLGRPLRNGFQKSKELIRKTYVHDFVRLMMKHTLRLYSSCMFIAPKLYGISSKHPSSSYNEEED